MKVFIMDQKNIDKMYYVNLSRRDDRRLKMEKQISDIQILSKMERYDGLIGKILILRTKFYLISCIQKKEKGYKLGISLTTLFFFTQYISEIYKKKTYLTIMVTYLYVKMILFL